MVVPASTIEEPATVAAKSRMRPDSDWTLGFRWWSHRQQPTTQKCGYTNSLPHKIFLITIDALSCFRIEGAIRPESETENLKLQSTPQNAADFAAI